MTNFDSNDSFVKGAEARAKIDAVKPASNLVMVNARVPKKLRDRVKVAAVSHNRSNASIIEEALEDWLKKAEKRSEKHVNTSDDGL
jgi:predicted HicB family RNase H-like nuclease